MLQFAVLETYQRYDQLGKKSDDQSTVNTEVRPAPQWLDLDLVFERVEYLFWLEDNSPDKYFEDGLRSSGLKTSSALNVRIDKKFNTACRMTDLVLNLARNNYERHARVEDFFLINGISTIAVEVPVWYWDKKIGGISGHIRPPPDKRQQDPHPRLQA